MEKNDQKLLQKLGLKIGHYTDSNNLTGTTAFIAEKGADIGIDIRGSNTGTLNTPAYDSKAVGKLVHGIVFTGGSTFGLESAFGVMQYLEEKKIGSVTRAGIIPGITGAVIYDIAVGKKTIPSKENGYITAKSASQNNTQQGNIGVGTGATTGKWFQGRKIKGGFGIGKVVFNNDLIVSAFAVTNSVGDIINKENNKFYSESNYLKPWDKLENINLDKFAGLVNLQPTNTTLVVIATNIALHKTQLMKVSELAHDGMARAIYPVHTNLDGDVIFSISSHTGERKNPNIPEPTLIDLVGLAAADATVQAINNSLIHANSISGFPSYSEVVQKK